MFIVVISRDTTLTAASSCAVLLPVEGFLNKYVEKKKKKNPKGPGRILPRKFNAHCTCEAYTLGNGVWGKLEVPVAKEPSSYADDWGWVIESYIGPSYNVGWGWSIKSLWWVPVDADRGRVVPINVDQAKVLGG